MEKDTKYISNKIKKLRKDFNISHLTLSKLLGCAKKTLIRYEKEESYPTDTHMTLFNLIFRDYNFIKEIAVINIDKLTENEKNKIFSSDSVQLMHQNMKSTITNEWLVCIVENENYYEDFVSRLIYNTCSYSDGILNISEIKNLVFGDGKQKIIGSKYDIHLTINMKRGIDYIIQMLNRNETITIPHFIKINKMVNENIVDNQVTYRDYDPTNYEDFVVPHYRDIQYEIKKILDRYDNSTEPVWLKISRFYVDFSVLLPFPDGNKRTTSLIVIFLLIKNNEYPSFFEEPDMEQFLLYCQKKDYIALAEFLKINSSQESNKVKVKCRESLDKFRYENSVKGKLELAREQSIDLKNDKQRNKDIFKKDDFFSKFDGSDSINRLVKNK